MRFAGEFLQRSPGHRRIRQLFLARGCHHQRGPLDDAAAHEGEQPEACLVCPVHVLEYQRKRLPGGEVLDELDDALEETELAVAGLWQARRPDFGEEPSELAPPDGCELGEHLLVGADLAAAERIDPRAEREDGRALVRAAEQDTRALRRRLAYEGAQQARLSDARLADHGHEMTAPSSGVADEQA